jgi:hypothetical protein
MKSMVKRGLINSLNKKIGELEVLTIDLLRHPDTTIEEIMEARALLLSVPRIKIREGF